jgi:hypothetical protein
MGLRVSKVWDQFRLMSDAAHTETGRHLGLRLMATFATESDLTKNMTMVLSKLTVPLSKR